MAKSKFSIIGILTMNVDNFDAKLKKAQKSLRKFKKTTDSVGNAANKMALPFILGIGAIVKASGDFQQQMARVGAATKASTEDMNKLEKAARKAGATTQFSATESAKTLEILGKAGLSANESIALLEPTLQLAVAGALDLDTAAAVTIGTMKTMGLAVKDITSINDSLAVTATSANTNIELLGESFKNIGGGAKLLNVSLADTNIFLATLAQNSITGGEAGTALKSTFLRLAKGGTEVQKGLGGVNMTLSDLKKYINDGNLLGFFAELREKMKQLPTAEKGAVVTALFGKNHGGNMSAILNTTQEEVDKLTESIRNSKGAAKEMAERGVGVWQKTLHTLKSTIESLLIDLGKAGLLKAITDITKELTDGVRYLIEHKEGVIKLGKAVGAFIIVAKSAQIAVAALNVVVSANPYVLAATAVLSLGAALYTLSGNVDTVSSSYKEYLAQTDKETARLTVLKTKLNDSNTKLSERKELIKEFNGLSKGYLDTMLTEKTNAEDIAIAYDKVTTAIKNKIAIQAKQDALTKIESDYHKTKADAIGAVYDRVFDDTGSDTQSQLAVEEFKKYLKEIQEGKMNLVDAANSISKKYMKGFNKFLIPRISYKAIIAAEEEKQRSISRTLSLYGEVEKAKNAANNPSGNEGGTGGTTTTVSSDTVSVKPNLVLADEEMSLMLDDYKNNLNIKLNGVVNEFNDKQKLKKVELPGLSSGQYEKDTTAFAAALRQAQTEYKMFGNGAKYADSVTSIFRDRINFLSQDMSTNADEVRKLIDLYNQLADTTQNNSAKAMELYNSSSETFGMLSSGASSVDNTVMAFENLKQRQDEGKDSFRDYMNVAMTVGTSLFRVIGIIMTLAGVQKKAAMGALSANATKGISAAIASAAMLPFPANLVAMGTAQTTATAQFASVPAIAKGIGATAFANGGVISGPTLSLMGEYPNAKNNPELVAPANKMMKYIRKAVGESNGGGVAVIGGTLKVEGSDLVIALENQKKQDGYF